MVLLKKFFESGRTMVEMLAVLGVLGIIAGGGAYGFAYAIDVFKSWSTQTQIADFSKGIEDLYGWHSNYKDVSMTGNGGICNNASAIMNTACEGDVFKSNWGGSLYAQPAAGGKGYKIILTDVPVRACKMLADMHWERVRPLDTSCNANRQTLTFVSYMQSECVPECSGNQTCEGGVCVCANGGIGESCDIVDPCETMNCEGVCRTGECVNGRCETVANGTSCEGGRCFDGECVVCISSDDCPECQACVGNVCRNRADGEVCSEGVCLNGVCGTADLCADVVCEECKTCNSDTGECEAVTNGTECTTGTCQSGVCKCAKNANCGAGKYCADSNSSCSKRTPNQCQPLDLKPVTITLDDGTKETWYVSNDKMSWWDAALACQSIGFTMAEVTDLVGSWTGSYGTHERQVRAEKLYDALSDIGYYHVWTKNLYSSCYAFDVNLADGWVFEYIYSRSEKAYLALCTNITCENGVCGCSDNADCGANAYCADANTSCTTAAPYQCKAVDLDPVTITLDDGTKETWYVSNSGISWWDAQNACEKKGKTMITVNQLIDSWDGTAGYKTLSDRAVKLKSKISDEYIWTSNQSDSCHAFRVILPYAHVSSSSRNNNTSDVSLTFCQNPSEDVICGECKKMNTSTGACEAIADGTACSDGVCTSGVCDLCTNVTCSCSTNDDCRINGFCADANSSCTSRTPTQCRSLIGYFARKTITLSDNTTETWYVSNGEVSWWDAQSACNKIGKTMVTVNELIDNWNGTTGTKTRTERAQKLNDAIGGYYVWTSDIYPSSSCYAFVVNLSNGHVGSADRSRDTLALCH